MLCGYLISNVSNAKIGPMFYFTLRLNRYITDYSFHFVNCRQTKNAVRHTQILSFGKKDNAFCSELVNYIIIHNGWSSDAN